MKHSHKIIASVLLLTIAFLSLVGCSSAQAKVECPFTEITWNSTPEDIQALEGELQDSYYSSFKGTTYVYEKEYLGLPGTIKYMFDDEEYSYCCWICYQTWRADQEFSKAASADRGVYHSRQNDG